MIRQISEKETLLSMLTGIYDQLEELESVLDTSFSEHRNHLKEDEYKKILHVKEKLKKLESKNFPLNKDCFEPLLYKDKGSMKLELGF